MENFTWNFESYIIQWKLIYSELNTGLFEYVEDTRYKIWLDH